MTATQGHPPAPGPVDAMSERTAVLDRDGLARFQALRGDAVAAVTDRFYEEYPALYSRFGPAGRRACSQDLTFHLEFLGPVLEYGLLMPMVDYLCWLDGVLGARGIPTEHLGLSLDWLGAFYARAMAQEEGAVVAAALAGARQAYLLARHEPQAPKSPPRWPEADACEDALLAGDHAAALAILQGCLERGDGLIDIELHVIQPALYSIGEKWQANQVSVAQEHLATSIATSLMTAGLLTSHPRAPVERSVLLACVEGNNHAVGLRMVADAFQLAGWRVHYLGADVPTRALIAHAADSKPQLIGLSVSFPHQLAAVTAVIQGLTDCFGAARPGVIVGGLAINRYSHLADMLGADAHCWDPAAALVLAGKLGATA
jgi:MerR family transcriptional regulator, light-induced transcriptional regulator